MLGLDTSARRSNEPAPNGSAEAATPPDSLHMARVVDRNIDALLVRRKLDEEGETIGERIAESITAFTGSMRFVYLHLGIFGLWILWNLGWLGLPRFDESFV